MLAGQDADVYLTGEMQHVGLLSGLSDYINSHSRSQHEVLAAVAAGKHVILCKNFTLYFVIITH
jgi:hypothetical protein